MEAIGELLEPITTNLYAWRVPIALASIGAVALLGLVGRRRGWVGWARRNPGRAGMVIVLALVLGGPIAWYLASPVFLRTSLVEAAPTVAPPADPSTPAPSAATSDAPTAPPTAGPTASSGPSSSPAPTPSATPFQPVTVATGAFTGTDDFHFGRGTASIIETAPGRFHLRLEDFSVRNGPDLFVYLSTDADGYADDAIELGRLKATDGSFGYDLPDGVDPSDFRSAIIWCKQFSHLFAVAPFDA